MLLIKYSSFIFVTVFLYVMFSLPVRSSGTEPDSIPSLNKQVLKCEVIELKGLTDRSLAASRISTYAPLFYSIATKSKDLRVVISTYRLKDDFLYGMTTSCGFKWFSVTLKYPDKSRWAYASIGSLDISPDGTKILAVEDTGRFASIQVKENIFSAHSGQFPYYKPFDMLITKDKDAMIYWHARRTIDILIDGKDREFAMRGLGIGQYKWLDDNRFFALTYGDGRVINIDAETFQVSKVLRSSKWKWKVRRGAINNLHAIFQNPKNLTKKMSTVFVSSKGKNDYVTPISFLGERFYLFRKYEDEDQAELRIIDTESGSVVWQHKDGSVIPVSDFEFVVLSSDDKQSKLEKFDIRTFQATYECNLSGTLKDIVQKTDSKLVDFRVSNNQTIHFLFHGKDERIQKIAFTCSNNCKIISSDYLKYEGKFIKYGEYKGLTLGPNGDTVRFCQFPKIIELKLN